MEPVDRCPCCGAKDWERVAASTYARDGSSASSHPGRRWADEVQRGLVFSEWLPGRDSVELTELLCRGCGVIVYSPRPSERDIARKYELLKTWETGPGTTAGDEPGEARRAARLRDRLAAELDTVPARVLEIGGGDGRLLAALLAAGARCFVVDYAERQIPGVERLGDTVDDLPADAAFDAVVLSHVLEHVAEPGALARRAAGLAAVLYAEVPVEIWRGTPIAVDPVIHVNHFTVRSLEATLRANGWRVARSAEAFSTYRGAPLEVAWAVAVRGQERDPGGAATHARRRLTPGIPRRLARRVRWTSLRLTSGRI
jgi:SAM-dependent methyltransferase